MTDNLPASLANNPMISTWITVQPDGTFDLRVGKVELGQGILTALTLIAASELGVKPGDVHVRATNTSNSPDEGLTAGSTSVTVSGTSVRLVCAEVRRLFTNAAVRHSGSTTRTTNMYADLAAEVDLNVPITESTIEFGSAKLIDDLQRIDLPEKVFGHARFIHDLVIDGMLHARIVRPPSQGAHLISAPIEEVKTMPGVHVAVLEGDFLAVIATREGQAERAAAFLTAQTSWTKAATLPDQAELSSWLQVQPTEIVQVRNDGARHVHGKNTTTLKATYAKPFVAHASIAPSCGLANFDGRRLEVWSSSQGVFRLRGAIAIALNLNEENVVVQHVEGAGSYGHNGADDAAFEAALLAMRMPGFPIRVQWTRADELSWEPFGPAMVSDIEATFQDGLVTDWSSQVWSNGHAGRPGYAASNTFLSEAHLHGASELPPSIELPSSASFGGARNAEPGYDFARVDVIAHRLLTMPIRSSALRSLGAHHNIFAIESFMDELAHAAGIDPLAFRLAHMRDHRAQETLTAAAGAANWGAALPSNVGRGIAYARYKNHGAYCAVVADIEAEGSVSVKRLTIAIDVGRIISADGVRNQIEGGAIQATSWAIHEQVRFDRERIKSSDWESYPILRFSQVPRVDVHLISRPDEPSLGAGEPTMGPVAAAIGNALFDLLGLRLRNLPFTSENIVSAIKGH